MAAPILKFRDVVNCLEGAKLEIDLSEKSGDLKGKLLIDGQYITSISLRGGHGGKSDLGRQGIRNLMKLLFLNGDQFKDLVNCPMSRDQYHEHLRAIGILPA